MNTRIVPCVSCQGEGRLITCGVVYEPGCGHAHMGEVDRGTCPGLTGRIALALHRAAAAKAM